jgi:hypothetical protein
MASDSPPDEGGLAALIVYNERGIHAGEAHTVHGGDEARGGSRGPEVSPDAARVAEILSTVSTTPCECAGERGGGKAPCSAGVVLQAIETFSAANAANAAKHEPRAGADATPLPSGADRASAAVRASAAILRVSSESAVLANPRFREFARKVGVPSQLINRELEIRFKTEGPRAPPTWLSNLDLDSKLLEWAHLEFKNFCPIPFAMMDFESTSAPLARFNFAAALDGKMSLPVTVDGQLEPGPSEARRPFCRFACPVNTDTSRGRGKHWVSVYVDCPPAPGAKWQVMYFNSGGSPPPRAITAWMEKIRAELTEYRRRKGTAAADIEVSSLVEVEHQRSNSECGVYTLYFIRRLLEGGSPDEFRNPEYTIPDAAMMAFRRHLYRGM